MLNLKASLFNYNLSDLFIFFCLHPDVVQDLYNMTNEHTKRRTPMISDDHYKIIMGNAERLNSCIIYDRDFSYNYFGLKTLERSYLLKIDGKIAERPSTC